MVKCPLFLLHLCLAHQFVLSFAACIYEFQTNRWFYNGSVSKTVNGRACAKWKFRNASVGVLPSHNFCRNPSDQSAEMWCYANGKKEYCDVGIPASPLCSNLPPSPSTVKCKPPYERQGDKIIGGKAATPHEFPFFAVLLDRQMNVFCGGSLVHRNYVLTAAHCNCLNPGVPASDITVKINVHDIKNNDRCVEVLKVSRKIPHPMYDRQSKFDYCLLELASPSSYSPVQLYTNSSKGNSSVDDYRTIFDSGDFEAVRRMLYITGFGAKTSPYVTYPVLLQKTQVPIVETLPCLAQYDLPQGEDRICAGYFGGLIDSCGGDSGGPLFERGATGFVLVGVVVGGGTVCARGAGEYGVYGRVSYVNDWIQTTINCGAVTRCYDCTAAGCAWVQEKNLLSMGCTLSCESLPTSSYSCYTKRAQCPEVAVLEVGTCSGRCLQSQRGVYTSNKPPCRCDPMCLVREDCCADWAYQCS